MSTTSIALTPAGQAPGTAKAPHAFSCPIATARCSCVFNRNASATATAPEPAVAPDDIDGSRAANALSAAVSSWLDWGWSVTDSTATEVVVQRRRGLGFCANLGLTAATGLLWLIYWVPRIRRPRYETVTLSVSSRGIVSTTAPLH